MYDIHILYATGWPKTETTLSDCYSIFKTPRLIRIFLSHLLTAGAFPIHLSTLFSEQVAPRAANENHK